MTPNVRRIHADRVQASTPRLSEAEVNTLLDQTKIWVATCTTSGELRFISPGFQEFLGVPFRQAPETELAQRYQLMAADARTPLTAHEAPLARARSGEVFKDLVISIRKPNGDARYLRCSGAPILDEDGRIEGGIVAAYDASASVAAVRQQADLRERLVSTINHELRTPLTKLFGHAELLEDLRLQLPAQARRSLTAVSDAAAELQAVVDTLSSLVDLERHLALRRTATDVAALTRDITRSAEVQAERRFLRLTCHAPRELVADIDPDEIRTALCALLRNALQYAPSGTEVELVLTWNDAGFSLRVCDRGAGIPAHERSRLVQPFERGNHPRQPLSSRGLGLAVAQAIAAAHGGRLTLTDNEPGLAATLTIPRVGLGDVPGF